MNQDGLLGRIVSVLEKDPRVQAAWLSGSRARGTHDEYSDIDVWLVTAPEDFDGFVASWESWSDFIGPTVLRQQVGQLPVFNHITPEWLRYDIVVATTDDVPSRSRTTVALLFDRAGLDEKLGEPRPPLQPDPARVRSLTTEFLRVLGLLPVVIGRAEYVVAVSGAALLRTLLIQLMTEDVAVEDRGGALHLRGLLPPDRLSALAALPAIEATRESAVSAHVACARVFMPIARDLCRRASVPWPADLENAARAHLRAAMSVELD